MREEICFVGGNFFYQRLNVPLFIFRNLVFFFLLRLVSKV